jgi:hypothetical protein
MQCHIGTLEILSRRNILMDALEGTLSKNRTFMVPDPEDLRGLREWVTAKRIGEAAPDREYGRIYSAPWRVG